MGARTPYISTIKAAAGAASGRAKRRDKELIAEATQRAYDVLVVTEYAGDRERAITALVELFVDGQERRRAQDGNREA